MYTKIESFGFGDVQRRAFQPRVEATVHDKIGPLDPGAARCREKGDGLGECVLFRHHMGLHFNGGAEGDGQPLFTFLYDRNEAVINNSA